MGGQRGGGPSQAEQQLRAVQAAQASQLLEKERELKRTRGGRRRAQVAARGGRIIPATGAAGIVASAFGSTLSNKLGSK